MSKTTSLGLLCRLGVASAALIGLASLSSGAHADKVGVAAAVNPDAFSSLSGAPQSQLNIGKSIFYNERINTTGSGLVQVLLVDGSTFTVGPGSDLVIDKFVYDPNKKTGQIVASLSKGVMRFVGGKISKNDEGVTIKTPAGTLAIRGGMGMAQVFGPKSAIFAFLYGVEMKLTQPNGVEKVVFEPGNGIFISNGGTEIKKFSAADINALMSALNKNSGTPGTPAPGTNAPPNGVTQQADANDADELISEATAQQINDQIQKEIDKLTTPTDTTTPGTPDTPTTPTTDDTSPPPPPNTLALGYAGGAFTNTGGRPGDPPAGTLMSFSPTDVALLFDGSTKAFSGAVFNLFSNDDGGGKFTFVPVNDSIPADLQQQFADLGVFLGQANTSTIKVFEHTIPGNPPQLDTQQNLTTGAAVLIGVSGNGAVFCESCDFMRWGAWSADLNINNGENSDHQPIPDNQIRADGWWVAADALPTIGELPLQGTASYVGTTMGQVAYNTGEGWQNFLAKGDVHMNWDFGQRAGLLEIKNFVDPGEDHVLPVLNASGRMDMPGELSAINKFSGPLLGTLGTGYCAPTVNGGAIGSFAANGADKTAGVIGNWSVGNDNNYKAAGIFGAGRDGPVNPTGHFDLPSPPHSLAFGPND